MYKLIILIPVLWIAFLNQVSSQTQDISFRHITVENGLSQNTVNDILKDKRGFMWFATNDGLNRYDGYEFKAYRRIPYDSNSLSNNKIYTLLEDHRGNLWIGTANGLNRYSIANDNFKRYLHKKECDSSLSHNFVRYLFEDSRNNLWAGTFGGGLNLYDPENDRFLPVKVGESSLENVTAIIEGSEGKLWIGSHKSGLTRFDPRTGKSGYYPFPDVSQDKERYGKNFYEDNSGNIWVGTEGGGLYVFDPSSETYKSIYKHKRGNSLSNNIVKDVIQVKSNLFWIATDGEGIDLLNYETGEFSNMDYEMDNPYSLNSDAIYTLYKDNHGIFWIGTFDGGINMYNTNSKDFITYTPKSSDKNSLSYRSVLSFHEDNNGRIWIGTDGGGLNLFHPEKEVFKHFRHDPDDPNTISSDVITAIYQDKQGILWVGTYAGGLNRINLKTGNIKHFKSDPNKPGSLANNNVWDIKEDRYGNLWIATLSGLDRMNREKGTFVHYNPREDAIIDYHNRVTTIYEDSDGILWLGGSFLRKLDREKNELVTIDYRLFNQFDVRCIYEDHKKRLWVGTEGGGLVHYNHEEDQFNVYNTKDGLPNAAVHAILEDDQGYLWLSTNKGLCKFHPDNQTIQNYDVSDGLKTNQFSYDAALKSANERFYFGSINGFTVFHPSQIRKNPYKPPVVITDFQIKNKSVPIGPEDSPLKSHVSVAEKITLNHNQDVFSFEFKALSYSSPKKNQYQIKMEGFDNQWRDLGNRRYASFTNLPPGEYTFRVKGSNNDGVWNHEGTSVDVVVLPPPWKTTWAYVGYGILVILILYAARSMLLYKARMKHEIQLKEMEKKKIEELNNMKIRFYTNVSHEFRTPLTLILSPLEHMLSQGVNDNYIRKQLTLIHQNAKRLLHLINQLMDFRKIESGHTSLHARRTDVVKFLKDVKEAFDAFAMDHNIDFQFVSEAQSYNLWLDREKMEKVFYNLLSNAFKFTHDGGAITVKVKKPTPKENILRETYQQIKGQNKKAQEYLNIIIEDTGIGISKERIPKIFERFHQIGSSSNLKSSLHGYNTGIGLALTKSLVELHKGNISVDSEEGKGTRFTISLPVGKSHLKPGQLVASMNLENTERAGARKTLTEEGYLEFNDYSPQQTDDQEENNEEENKKYTVLVIEDDEVMQEFVRGILIKNYRVIQAIDGTEGVEKAREYNPDLIISDIMMKEKDGISLSKELKQDLNTSHIPIILLTALSSEDYQIEGFRKGADEYVTKPFNPELLVTRIQNLIDSRERLREHFRKKIICEPSDVTLTSVDEQFLKRAVEIVEENISDPQFNVPKLIAELGTSRSALYRKLRALVDQSANEFIRSIRLKRAAQLLVQNQLTVSEISYRVGFNDPQYFSKSFKKEFNMTPTNYAYSNKKEDKTSLSDD